MPVLNKFDVILPSGCNWYLENLKWVALQWMLSCTTMLTKFLWFPMALFGVNESIPVSISFKEVLSPYRLMMILSACAKAALFRAGQFTNDCWLTWKYNLNNILAWMMIQCIANIFLHTWFDWSSVNRHLKTDLSCMCHGNKTAKNPMVQVPTLNAPIPLYSI